MVELLGNLLAHSLTHEVVQAVADVHTQTYAGPEVEGMTSNNVRQLLHKLAPAGGNYLEIGVWKGSTFLAATADSCLAHATAIDHWLAFGGPREEFHANLAAHRDRLPPTKVIDANCWDVPLEDIPGPVDLFFYDGGHAEHLQKRAITHFWPILNHPCIVVIDDWNDPNHNVPRGTMDGFRDVDADIAAQIILNCAKLSDANGWWRGVAVTIVR